MHHESGVECEAERRSESKLDGMIISDKSQKGPVVVFLDIDGVLLPFSCQERSSCGALFPDHTLSALTTILEAVPAAKIVLSSNWRVQASFRKQIIDSFRAYGYSYGGPLADMNDFYDITDPDMHSERQYEIDAWLSAQDGPPLAWIVLDDEDILTGDANAPRRHVFTGRVVQTDSHLGLTDEDAKLAIQLLQNQLAEAKGRG